MNLEDLRPLFAAMLAADLEYRRAEPDDVHIAHAELRAKRFAFNKAAGEFVAELLEKNDD